MNRNRKKSSTQEEARPSTSAKTREDNDLAYFVHDRVTLMREVFSILKPKEIKSIAPECVRKLSLDNLEELCLEELLGISSKRLCAILDGAEPPSDTESSSSDSSSSSESEMSERASPAAVEEIICLDSESNDDSSAKSKKKKKHKKKKKKRKHKSTDNTTNSVVTVDTIATEQNKAKKSTQPPSTSTKSKQNEQNIKNISTNAAILNRIGGKSDLTFLGKVARGKETSRAAERVGMTILEILEVQARARAIRAQLNREKNEASQARPSTSTNNNIELKQKDSSDSEIEIKEETAEIVDLLSSSSDDDAEEKPKVGDLEVVAVKEPDPPPASTKNKDKTKIKKSKTANPIPTATITSEYINKSKPTEDTDETITPEKPHASSTPEKSNKRLQESNPKVEKRLKTVSVTDTDRNNLLNPTEELPNSKNNVPNTEAPFSTDTDLIKKEEERESSPDVIVLEDSDNEIMNDDGNKKQPKSPKSPESNNNSVQSIVKVIDAPKTTDRRKSNRKNDFTITVTQNSQRKVTQERDNVVISFSNDANANEAKGDGNSFSASTQKKDVRERSSDIIEQSAKKLNSTVTKIINERSKINYVKSVVKKTSDKGRFTQTNRKARDKTSHDRNKAKEKDKNSDDDEITLQLSDSEKMDVLEDLNPKILDKISENTGSDTKSSASDDSSISSDETEKSDKQGVCVTNVASDSNYKKDVNQDSDKKNDNTSREKAEITTNNNNTDPTKQNNGAPKDSVSEEPTTKTIISISEIKIPKAIINNMENQLNQPVKTIIRHLRVNEMVSDEPKESSNKCISENNDEISTTVNIAKESSLADDNEVSNDTPFESNLISKICQDKDDNTSQNIDLSPVNNRSNVNILEIRSIRDIPILPDYNSGDELSPPKHPNTNLEKEIIVAKDIPQDITKNKSKQQSKKKRKKLNRDRGVSIPSSDDIAENNVILREVKEKEFIKANVIDDTMSMIKSSRLEAADTLREEDRVIYALKDPTVLKTNDLLTKTRKNSQDSETKVCHTDKNHLETEKMQKETHDRCKQTDQYSSRLETNPGGCASIDGGKTSDVDGKPIEARASVEEANKIATDDQSGAMQDRCKTEIMMSQTSETLNKIERNDVVEQDELEEGEITDDHKRQLSEEGEITTDTESEIEARDVETEIICISDGEIFTTENIDDITTENKGCAKQTKNNEKKHLCKKCKRKKNSQKNDDQNFYRNSISENNISKNVKVKTVNELPTDLIKSDISTLNIDTTPVNKISNNNDLKGLEIEKISIDSDSDSDSDPNTINSDELKTQSKNFIKDKFKPDAHNNISNTNLLSPNINLTDPETLETLEISDDSSDCYEILSKEPTTEEIEALSEKIDRIERIEVVTNEEIIQYENSNDSNTMPICHKTITSKNQATSRNNHDDCFESQNLNENPTETIPDENISWKDRYIKSKKVTKVLTTSNILNALRKKNLDLKKKLLESKIEKTAEEIKEIVEVVPETVEIGSIEHYNTLESSTKYVDPVQEPTLPETEIKDTNLTTDPVEVVKTNENETLVNTTTETQIVTKEMKKHAKELYKMYKKLLKHNNMYKEKDANKKKKKIKGKNKDGDASSPGDVTETVLTTNCD